MIVTPIFTDPEDKVKIGCLRSHARFEIHRQSDRDGFLQTIQAHIAEYGAWEPGYYFISHDYDSTSYRGMVFQIHSDGTTITQWVNTADTPLLTSWPPRQRS